MAAAEETVTVGVEEGGEGSGTVAEGAGAPSGAPPADPPEEKTGAEPGAGTEPSEAAEAAPPPTVPEAKPPSLDDLRSTVADAEHRRVLDRFNSLDDMAKAIVDLRKRESTVRVPGKDASEDDLAAYHKAIGVPDDPAAYEFTVPDGHEPSEDDKAFQAHFGEVFHKAALSTDQAKALNAAWNEFSARAEDEIRKADEAYVKDTEQALRTKWGGDYDVNRTLARRGAEYLFGSEFEAATQLEMREGRFLLDHPAILEAFSKVGAEIRESGEGPRMGDSERETLSEQIDDVGRRKMEALDAGDRATAARLDAEQLSLIERRDGVAPIVGNAARNA